MGGSGPVLVFWGISVLFPVFKISSDHFALSTFPAVLFASDNIWLCKVEWTDYRPFRWSVEIRWFLVLPCLPGCYNAATIRIQTHTRVITETGTGKVHAHIPEIAKL